MENANNIIEMLNKIENTLNVLTRRVSELEGRVNVTQPMGVNPYYNTNPYNNPMGMLNPVEMQLSYGNYSRRPQGNPQYNPQYRPQYVVSKSVEELNSIKLCLINHFTNCAKQGLSANDDGVINKIDAIERILLDGLNNLQYNYNYSHSVVLDLISISKAVSDLYNKHCFNSLFNNKNIPRITQSDIANINALKQDIEVLANNWNIKTVNNNDVNNSYTVKPVSKENLSDMEEWANNNGHKFQQPTMSKFSNSYKPYISRQVDPIIIDIIVDALTITHKVNLTVYEKNVLNKLKTLKYIPEDIYNHVTSLHLHVTQYKCVPEIIQTLLTSIIDMMYDRGHMRDFVSEEGTVNDKPMNSVDNIKRVDQNSNVKKPTIEKSKRHHPRKR